MKPNLKELYEILDGAKYQVGTGNHQRWVIDFESVVVPLEDFQKQLQESLNKAQKELKLTSSADARHCGFLAGLITAKKEILGLEEK